MEIISKYKTKSESILYTNLAPVVLFVYSRPDHTKRTIEALKLNKEERFLYIPHFVVRAPFRHKGVGHTCIKYLLEKTKSEGFETLRLEVLKTNANAIQFYHKEGFVLKEERENTYLLEKSIK